MVIDLHLIAQNAEDSVAKRAARAQRARAARAKAKEDLIFKDRRHSRRKHDNKMRMRRSRQRKRQAVELEALAVIAAPCKRYRVIDYGEDEPCKLTRELMREYSFDGGEAKHYFELFDGIAWFLVLRAIISPLAHLGRMHGSMLALTDGSIDDHEDKSPVMARMDGDIDDVNQNPASARMERRRLRGPEPSITSARMDDGIADTDIEDDIDDYVGTSDIEDTADTDILTDVEDSQASTLVNW